MRLPPRGVERFLCWHVLKLEFWHFAHPELNLCFVIASVFAVLSNKECIAHRFLQCFFADSRLFAHASLDFRSSSIAAAFTHPRSLKGPASERLASFFHVRTGSGGALATASTWETFRFLSPPRLRSRSAMTLTVAVKDLCAPSLTLKTQNPRSPEP